MKGKCPRAETRLDRNFYPRSGSGCAYRTSDQRDLATHINRVPFSSAFHTDIGEHNTPVLHRVLRCNAAFSPSPFVFAAPPHDAIAHLHLFPPTTFSGTRTSSTVWNSTRCFLQPFENSTPSSRGLRVNDAEISSRLVNKTDRKTSEI
jgi:hypothetical protein